GQTSSFTSIEVLITPMDAARVTQLTQALLLSLRTLAALNAAEDDGEEEFVEALRAAARHTYALCHYLDDYVRLNSSPALDSPTTKCDALAVFIFIFIIKTSSESSFMTCWSYWVS